MIHTMRVYKSDSHKDLKFAATCTCGTDGRFASEGTALAYAEEHKIKRSKGIDRVTVVNDLHPPKVEAKEENPPTDAAGAAKPEETLPPYAVKA